MNQINGNLIKKSNLGFSIAEVMVSAAILSAISLIIAQSFSEINKLDVKLFQQIKKIEHSKNLASLLTDQSICLANFNGINANADHNNTTLFIDSKKLTNFKSIDPDYKSHKLKLASKSSFFENIYAADLEIQSNDITKDVSKFPLFVEVKSGKISNCSSLFGTSFQPPPNSPCNSSTIGATRYDKANNLAMICNGIKYKPIEIYGGMYKISYHDGNTFCDYKNPLTGNCNCPAGYQIAGAMGFGQGAHGDGDDCIKDDGIMNYRYDPETESYYKITNKTKLCGFNMIICLAHPNS